MGGEVLSNAQQEQFRQNGFVLSKALFDAEETALLRSSMERDPKIVQHSYDLADPAGKVTKMTLWNHPGDSVYGLAARCTRIVDSMELLLGGEVYHYHTKLSVKESRDGGEWAWHQDYGYWYDNGCLFPLLASVMVALDANTKENGCLKVLRGSHHLGRINHGPLTGHQTGADPVRVTQAVERLETVYIEMAPGDALFFHCNTLHSSEPNTSAKLRRNLLCCYNAARNDPVIEHHHPRYTPLHKVADSAIKEAGLRFANGDDEAFLIHEEGASGAVPSTEG